MFRILAAKVQKRNELCKLCAPLFLVKQNNGWSRLKAILWRGSLVALNWQFSYGKLIV
jgi:hypothetical protein